MGPGGRRMAWTNVRCISASSFSAPATTSGWRYDGAATSNDQLSVIQEIARTAERGKFDLLFVSDGLVMNPGDHPSFLCRFEPTTLISVLAPSPPISDSVPRSHPVTASRSTSRGFSPRSTTSAMAVLPGTSSPAPTHGSTQFQPRRANGARASLRGRQRIRRCRQGIVGLLGGRCDRRRQNDRPFIDADKVRPLNHQGRFFQVEVRSTWRARRRAIR